jgi:hypothetical protein
MENIIGAASKGGALGYMLVAAKVPLSFRYIAYGGR